MCWLTNMWRVRGREVTIVLSRSGLVQLVLKMYNPTPHFMSLYTVVNELRMRRALSLALMQSHSVRVASWRKDCDWRALSNYPLQSVGSSRAFLPSPHCPPSCKRLLGDGCRQRGTSVISIRVFFLSVFSNIRICPSRYG